MARERWFYAREFRRMGPLRRRQLVESLPGLPDPGGCLIWRHGLPAWTPARDVPEIDRQIAPFAKGPAPEPEAAPATPVEAAGAGPAAAVAAPATDARSAPRAQPPGIGLYFGGLGLLLLIVVGGWLVWRRSNGASGETAGAASARQERTAAPGGAAETAKTADTAAAGTPRGFTGWSDDEGDLPGEELRRLRGVGGWSGQSLTITVYNGSSWRVTEILVRTSLLSGDEFVDAETPQRMVPAPAARVEAGTAALLDKVAPDRKKPGVNPLDTGAFAATVGPQPPAYRWRIEGARGYAPRGGR